MKKVIIFTSIACLSFVNASNAALAEKERAHEANHAERERAYDAEKLDLPYGSTIANIRQAREAVKVGLSPVSTREEIEAARRAKRAKYLGLQPDASFREVSVAQTKRDKLTRSLGLPSDASIEQIERRAALPSSASLGLKPNATWDDIEAVHAKNQETAARRAKQAKYYRLRPDVTHTGVLVAQREMDLTRSLGLQSTASDKEIMTRRLGLRPDASIAQIERRAALPSSASLGLKPNATWGDREAVHAKNQETAAREAINAKTAADKVDAEKIKKLEDEIKALQVKAGKLTNKNQQKGRLGIDRKIKDIRNKIKRIKQ